MGQSTAQTRPRLPSLRPQSEASLEHGLPPAPAPLPCIFPKDWYEAPAPRCVGGGGLGLNFPGLWRRLWEVEEQRSRCHSGPGPPRLPLQPLREMAFPWGQLSPCGLGLFLPLLASPFF